MEKKTNKAKLEILKIFENISFIGKAIAFDKIGSNYDLSANSTKNMVIRAFLHAELISAMKNSSKSYDFCEKCKKIEK